MIARNITKAREEKVPIIHKLELKKLSDVALEKVSKNFLLYPVILTTEARDWICLFTILNFTLTYLFDLLTTYIFERNFFSF